MLRVILLAGLLSCLSVNLSKAVDLPVAEKLVFRIDLAGGWTLHLADPPEALVKETASHIAHEPAAARATPEQVEMVARNRLAANEAIVYHASSGAHLDIDFSPFDDGAPAPGPGALRKSAEHAGLSLANEPDVTDTTWEVIESRIAGARAAFLLKANFLKHGQPMVFRGYVGTVERFWFFLYFTAPGDDPQILEEMESMLANASIHVVGH